MSTQRTMPGGRVPARALPTGNNGRALCRWCALEVPRGRRTFCSAYCVHEWRLRTDPGYLRQQVFARDGGVCGCCRVDTLAAYRRLLRTRGQRRGELLAYWRLNRLTRKSLWDADHITPVAEGGGECDIHNLRTLCLRCHFEATAALRLRLQEMRLAVAALSV